MRIIETVLATHFRKNSTRIAPITVKRYFGSKCNNYKLNKQAAITLTERYLKKHCRKELNDQFENLKKKDDAGDAILQGVYYLNINDF